MNAANLLCPESFPSNIIYFPSRPGQIPRNRSSARPVNTRRDKELVEEPAKAPKRRVPENPIECSRLAELFTMKREEKPPENFMKDFMAEFARRNYAPDKA